MKIPPPPPLSLILLLAVMVLPNSVWAGSASLSIYPQSGTFTVGSTFDVSIFLNTGRENVTAIRVNLKFDPEKLQVVTPTKGLSSVGEWVLPPSFSNSVGEISLQGGFPSGGINTSEGLISQIVFEAVASGKTEVNLLDSSKVLAGKEGANILTSVNRGSYDIILAPSRGPKIFSESHSDQNKWYKNNSPVFSWDKAALAEGYSYSIDDDPYGEPDNIIDTQDTSASLENVEEGIRYFHLKAKRNFVWGGASNFKMMVDASPPLEFKLRLKAAGIYFNTSDLLSGLNRYEVRITDISHPQNVIISGWIRQESPFLLNTEKPGNYRVLVRAFDEAGNFREEEIQMRIFGSALILVPGGIQIKGLSLSWWSAAFLLIIILLGARFLILSIIKRKSEITKVDLEKEIREAEKEIADVRVAEEKLRKIRMMEEKAKEESERLAEKLKPPKNET